MIMDTGYNHESYDEMTSRWFILHLEKLGLEVKKDYSTKNRAPQVTSLLKELLNATRD